MKPTTIRMDTPDPTEIDQRFFVHLKINNIGNPPYRKLECSGNYDKKTVDAILTLMGFK
jgi:hypothetical protein